MILAYLIRSCSASMTHVWQRSAATFFVLYQMPADQPHLCLITTASLVWLLASMMCLNGCKSIDDPCLGTLSHCKLTEVLTNTH